MTTIAGLLSALGNNAVTDITVANGTYTISGPGFQNANSLYITYASRTNPVRVHPDTTYGVTFSAGSSSNNGCITFAEGAHDQTWDGFVWANVRVAQTGCATFFNGYANPAAPHNITLSHMKVLGSVTGTDGNCPSCVTHDHGVYVAQGHDLTFDTWSVDASGGLDSGFQIDGSPAPSNITLRNWTIDRAQQAVILYEAGTANVLIDGATITNSTRYAIEYGYTGTNIVVSNVTSTGSGEMGLHADRGTSGLTVTGSSLQ